MVWLIKSLSYSSLTCHPEQTPLIRYSDLDALTAELAMLLGVPHCRKTYEKQPLYAPPPLTLMQKWNIISLA